jgi:hypothetical protein
MQQYIKTHISAFLLIIGSLTINAQDKNLDKLISMYNDNNYEQVYEEIASTRNQSNEIIVLKALAFHNLSDKRKREEKVNDKYIHPLKIIQKIHTKKTEQPVEFEEFFISGLKKLQEDVFNRAKKLYETGIYKKADRYFNQLHSTFKDTNGLLKNQFAFDDSYFLQILKNEIEVPEEFRKNFFNRYDLINKYYHSNKKFKKWNNPKYRLANTAKNEDYLKEHEKMVFYFLNLVRMNPELFRETFVHAKLHIQYHGDLKLNVPVYDSLKIDKYGTELTLDEFFQLPVHRIFQNDLPASVIENFVQKTVVRETKRGKRYRYDIKYKTFYNYLTTEKPELLNLRNLSGYNKTEDGSEFVLYKLYEKEYSIYRKSYDQETKNSFYYQSLFTKLTSMRSKSIIYPNKDLFKTAECWAVEAGKRGLKGHDRIKCSPDYDAESCDYGNRNGFDVVLNLLIDKFVSNLGHRKMLLGNYSQMGVAIRPHDSGFEYNAVLDFYK